MASSKALSKSRVEILRVAFNCSEDKFDETLRKAKAVSGSSTPFAATLSDATPDHKLALRLKLGNIVADAAEDNVDIAAKVLQDPKVTSPRDIAINYGCHRIETLAPVSGSGDAYGTRNFALRFRRRMFVVEPTAVLQQMTASDDEENNPSEKLPVHPSAEIRKETARFLSLHPNFNIRQTSVLTVLHKDKSNLQNLEPQTQAAVVGSLKLLQRVQALTPAPEAIKPLLEAGLTSAMRVSSIPRKQFASKLVARLSGPGTNSPEIEHLVDEIHSHAMTSRLWAENVLVQFHEVARGTGITAIDGVSSTLDKQDMFNRVLAKAVDSPDPINLDSLFGDMDICECEECLDVTSPTAYYVDLLQYLRNNNLDNDKKWENTGKEGIAGTALEKLFARRPDLQHLQLTCANANTALPMIDLANEVMEAFTIHLSDFANSGNVVIETWNVRGETTEELLGSPSHTRKKAYCILKEEFYPIARLPYFQPLDATRLYLEYLGTSRFELIDTLRLAQRQWVISPPLVATPEKMSRYVTLRGQIQDRAVTAEYLGFSPDEYIIITRESLWPIASSEFADDGIPIDQNKYRESIGVKDPHVYWGYSDPNELLNEDATRTIGLSFVKAQFLQRSGLTFAETADLLRTKFVNPMIPTGKAKILLDNIRFSYRFLQNAVIHLIGSVERRNQALGEFLFNTQAWVQAILATQVPPTGNPLVKPEVTAATFTQAEIVAWVRKWFDCLGKLIVLESGEGPRLPVQGYLVWLDRPKASILSGNEHEQSKVLGYLDDRGEIWDDKNQPVGFVWVNGQVLYGGLVPIRTTYPHGKIALYPFPRQTGRTPKLEELRNGPLKGQVIGKVNVKSYLETVPLEGEPSVVEWLVPPDTCSIEDTRILHLNGKPLELWEWDRINRFIRLYTKLHPFGWTIAQINSALMGLWKVPEIQPPVDSPPVSSPPDPRDPGTPPTKTGFSFSDFRDKGCICDDDDDDDDDDGNGNSTSPCDPSNFINISPGFLKELMSVQKLERLTGLELEKLLCLWSDISTFGEKSLYKRLFLTHDLESIDTVFQPDESGNYLTAGSKIGDHRPVIIAALRFKADVFDAVLQSVSLTNDSIITVANLTKLYRHTLLSAILGITPKVLLDALDLFSNPYISASVTLELVLLWSRMSATSFTIKQLRYIIKDLDDPLRPVGPDKVKILRLTKTIMDGLVAIDVAHSNLTSQEEDVLTAAQVKAKSMLIFEPPVVDNIMGLLEGTKLYTTNAPVGLVVDKSNIPAKVIYKDPLTPPNRRATLSVVGCLTDAELETTRALFVNNADWASALQRLQKQARNLVKSILAPVFPDNVEEVIANLTKGDVPAMPPVGTDDQGDPGTAIAKRVYFMQKLMPFLRSYMHSKFIAATVSSAAAVSADISTWLLTDVIKTGGQSAINVLINLKNTVPSNGPPASWTGYLIPPSSDTYVFYGHGNTQPPALVLGGVSIPFSTQNEDPSDLWWTAPVPLIGGKLVGLQVTEQTIPGDLQWKTERGGITAIPANALVPDSSAAGATSVFAPLSKASMVIQGFGLSLIELQYLQSHSFNFSGLDFNAITLDAWKRLLAYYEMRKALPSREVSLVDLFKWADLREEATEGDISLKISAVTAWDVDTIKVLLDKKNLDLGDVKRFQDEVALSKLHKIFLLMQKTGIRDIELMLSWTDLKLDINPTWKLAKSIRQTIRGKYSASDYEQAIKPSHDQLRKNQRDALIAYLLSKPSIRQWGATDANGLFEFFLLDVQIGSCMQTSRTKQAISSVQLFVQRCILGLEEKYGVANDALDAERWQWMSKQTVWAANRKVFLYAENWLVPSLRDNKTPIYTDLESELLQRDVNTSNVLESFKNYTTKLAQIAQLRAVGLHIEVVELGKHVLHCVAMTAGSPYLFFHRKYSSSTREWTPWIRITVDIPTYTVEWSTEPQISMAAPSERAPRGRAQVATATGCYVVPVAWMSRALLFIGEITKKTVPNASALDKGFSSMTGPTSTISASSIAPKEVWETRLSWTEYRSGKWTQKQVTSESFPTEGLPDIDAFQFMPHIVKTTSGGEYVSIEVWHLIGSSQSFDGNFVFDGTTLRQGTLSERDRPVGWRETNFQLIVGRSSAYTLRSLQKSADGTTLPFFDPIPDLAPKITYEKDANGVIHYGDGRTDIFYHPFSSDLISAASISNDTDGIGTIERVYRSLPTKHIDPTFGTVVHGPSEPKTYAELSKTYTNYNWELGFHGPMQVADALIKSQQYDQALGIIHQVFDPYADGEDIRRVWKWYPFEHSSSERVLQTLLAKLKAREYDLNITQWRDHPFQPFVIARGRTVVYMKWTVMMYITALIAYGDMYFRRRTLEDIPLAIQLYTLASHMYGPKGETIPKRGKKVPQTYFSLLDKWDAFSNAIVQLEIAFPFSNQAPFPTGWTSPGGQGPSSPVTGGDMWTPKQIALANIFGFATSSYFCLPSNPRLQALRATIDQRLYNIRNCLDIDGRPLPLMLWEAPIDPGQLVAAVASGLSLSSALNDLNASLPNYRFTWLLARALEMASELKGLESTFVSIKEKRDGEALQLLRSGHEIVVHNMVMKMKKVQLEEAVKAREALQAGQESPKHRFDFYSRLAGVEVKPLGSTNEPFMPRAIDIDIPSADSEMHMNKIEIESEVEAMRAQFWNQQASNLEIMAGILHVLPSFNIHGTPMGCGIETAWGMPNIAAAFQAVARQYQLYSSEANFRSGQSTRKAAAIKQYQDRVHQMNLAGLEFEHLNSQIASQEVRIRVANTDIANQQQLIDNAAEVDAFLRNKYTNDELYSYLDASMRTTMYQTYLMAYDLAKKAELAFRFERRLTAVQKSVDLISFGYFNPARDGLQASHQLYLALKNMEVAYQDSRGHDYEITKSISLRQLNPYALLTLRETGSCTFDVPEVLFDMDFPGHFFRRIKTVSLTMPCVVGPYTGVNTTLRLLKHRYRADALATSARDYVEDTESGALDPRFRTAMVPIDAVATSSAQNDAGAFELALKDERYIPFEGAGVVATWELTLPPSGFRPFDYASIADVVMAVRYTACEGGAGLRRAAAASVMEWVATVEGRSKDVGLLALWDVRAEFAVEWAKLAGGPAAGGGEDVRTLVLKGLGGRLPAFVAGRDPATVRATDVSLLTTLPITQAGDLVLDFKYVLGGSGDDEVAFDSGPSKMGALSMFRISEADNTIGDWALKLKLGSAVQVGSASRMWIIVRYRLLKQN